MIVIEQVDSDVTSITNTLISPEDKKIPRYYVRLIYASLFLSTLAFIFSLVDIVNGHNPAKALGPILACILTLPHHGATLLLVWLRRHQTASIFRFSPYSRSTIAYSIFLVIAWLAATAVSSLRVNNLTDQESEACLDDGCDRFWPSVASTLTSVLEFMISAIISLVSYRRRQAKAGSAPSPSAPVQPTSKVVSP